MGFNFTKIENISSINIGDHAVLFYKKNEELLTAVHSFVKRSLKNNEKCIYIDSKSNQKKILAELNKTLGNTMEAA